MSTLHRYLKYKLGDKRVFAKTADVKYLTLHFSILTCRELEFKKGLGLKTKAIDVVTVEIVEVIKLDMNRYLLKMVSAQKMLDSPPTEPLCQYTIDIKNKESIFLLVPITDRGLCNLFCA